MAAVGRALTTLGAVVAVTAAMVSTPPHDPSLQRTANAVELTADYMTVNVRRQNSFSARAIAPKWDLKSVTGVPRGSAVSTSATPPLVTAFEFEDAIINTYNAIEPWVRYGFKLATYAVGWVPWVGWLAPQIMIFYDFGERIVESLVVNSANWLWGPLPFFEGLGNVARDSWEALVQLGIDEWNFWLPPLPPFPRTAERAAEPAQDDGATEPADQLAAESNASQDPTAENTLDANEAASSDSVPQEAAADEGAGTVAVTNVDDSDVTEPEDVTDTVDTTDSEAATDDEAAAGDKATTGDEATTDADDATESTRDTAADVNAPAPADPDTADHDTADHDTADAGAA